MSQLSDWEKQRICSMEFCMSKENEGFKEKWIAMQAAQSSWQSAVGCFSLLLITKTVKPKLRTTWDQTIYLNRRIVNRVQSWVEICKQICLICFCTERRSCLLMCLRMLPWGVEVCSPLWEGSRAVRRGWSRTSWRRTERSAHLLEALLSPHSSYTSTSTHVTLCLIMGKFV